MDVIPDFEDILALFHEHEVRYLIIGGLAFIYHAKPRYTKDIDIWVDPDKDNIQRANVALAAFGSPYTLDAERPSEILQLGVPPNRIDLIRDIEGMKFSAAWEKKIVGSYGNATAMWIDIDSLIRIKSQIREPRHQDDVRVLKKVQQMRKSKK